MKNPIIFEAQAAAVGLRESAIATGGALGVRMNQAAALLEKMAAPKPDTEVDALNAFMNELDSAISIVRVATHAVDDAEDGEVDLLASARNSLYTAVEMLDEIRHGLDARILKLDTEATQ